MQAGVETQQTTANSRGSNGNLRPFKAGQSGNPRGRPKKDLELAALCREHSAEGLAALLRVIKRPKSSPSAVISAVGMLWDRGYGRAPQTLELSGPGGGPIVLAELSSIERQQLMLEMAARVQVAILEAQETENANDIKSFAVAPGDDTESPEDVAPTTE